MGKPFVNELKHIPTTIEQANLLDVGFVKKYLCDNIGSPFFIVGSGGAIAIAETLVLVIEQLQGIACALTPYELAMKSNILPQYNVIFVTANGRNPDIVNAYDCAKKSDAKSTFCICLKKNSKLLQRAREKYTERYCFEWDLPCGRDGFLAVNSSIAFLTIFAKILGNSVYINFEEIQTDLNSLPTITLANMTYIALGGGWSLPVAIDFESKCTEAGLANVQIADYRNFAHGRHHWLAKNPNSIILAFSTENDNEIISRTFKIVPNDYQKFIISSCQSGICATIELMIKMFYVVYYIGVAKKIDPGKPGVPDFGSELYHMSFRLDQTSWVKTISDKNYRACFRKFGYNMVLDNNTTVEKSADKYWEQIKKARYRGIVFDYDGTIIHDNNTNEITFLACAEQIVRLLTAGLHIGFATGRGGSIRQQLLKIIPAEYQEHVIIGYNNGAFIECLRYELNRVDIAPNPDMVNIQHCLSGHPILSKIEKKDDPYQISLFVRNSDLLSAKYYLQNKIDVNNWEIRLVISDHSIDIIPKGVSKISLIERIKELCKGDVLCIGDSFQEFGNDYDMQISDYALSVNSISFSEDLCWNFSQPGIFGAAATLEYLKELQIDELGQAYFK